MASLLLLLLFSRLRLRNRHISRIGMSCFAAYLLHASLFFYNKIYFPIGLSAFRSEQPLWISLASMTLAIIAIFTLTVMIDRARIALWRKMKPHLFP